MKKFLTLFPLTSNIHLTKDVGMIPYILFKDFGYESTLACYDNGNYEYLENEVKGLKIVFIKRIFNNVFIDSLLFLLFNGRKYDILQLYHLNRWNAALAYFFKVFTVKRRFTYLKLDTEEYVLDFKFSGLTRGQLKF
jgi:L-malate glycosyltransferase